MKKVLGFILIIIFAFVTSLEIYAFTWPLGEDEEPQKIIATFAEFRVPDGGYPTNHIHDGVDIQRYGGVDIVWGVEWEEVWYTTATMVRTDFHDFAHLVGINPLLVDDYPVDKYTIIADEYETELYNHLHFNSRRYQEVASVAANNPLDPDFTESWRLDPLCDDYNNPTIHEIFLTLNGNYQFVLDPWELPENTDVDIIVKAEEFTTNPQDVDPRNGVHRVLLDLDWGYWKTVFEFDAYTEDWDVDYVYDASGVPPNHRSDNSNFYYVVTNEETSDGWWNTGEGDNGYWINIIVEDEQGNSYLDYIYVWVTKGSGADEKKPDKFELSVNNLNPPLQATEINYSLPKKSKVYLNIYDSMGRLVNTLVNKEQKAGIYTVKWNEKNKLNKFLPNGIYFCNLRAGDFEANEKIVLLSH
jgi:hypothetical protein